MLRFSEANAKTQGLVNIKAFVEGRRIHGNLYSLDLPAGHTCPGADICKSAARKKRIGWRIVDGPNCRFRCYAASQEVVFPNTRNLRHTNLNILRSLRTPSLICNRILKDLPQDIAILRLHTSGDFFKQTYFDGILQVAKARPHILFYAYTKCINMWVKRKKQVNSLKNLRLTASLGGKFDDLARKHRLPSCQIVCSQEEADSLGLPIDHDDSYASGLREAKHFCVLLHGPQPKGSAEAKAIKQLYEKGLSGYRRNSGGYGLAKLNRKR